MKKSLVALAALAASTAFAQSANMRPIAASNVALFGVADLAMTNIKADGAGSFNRVQGEGRNESSRLGIRGMEDLGGGWAAAFWFEAGVNYDSGAGSTTTSNNTSIAQNGILTGTSNSTANPTLVSAGGQQGLTFNRASTVSLLNRGLGEARIGRDYVPTFWNYTLYDPFGTVGVGSATNLILGTLNPSGRAAVTPPGNPTPQVRSSNSIGWLSPDWNGFRAQVLHGLSEQISTCTDLQGTGAGQAGNLCSGKAGDGKYTGYRVSYNKGPLSLAAASGETKYNNTTTAALSANAQNGYSGNFKAVNFGAGYDFGVARVLAQTGYLEYGAQSLGAATAAGSSTTAGTGVLAVTGAKVKHNLIGVTAPVGAWTLKASYATASREGGDTSIASGFASGTTQPTIANITNGKQTQIALGAVYDLSKRTALYGTYSKLEAKGTNATASMGLTSRAVTATAGASTTGFDIGIRHRF